MRFRIAKGSLETFKADVIVITSFEKEREKGKKSVPASLLKEDGGINADRALKSQISKTIVAEEFAGSLGKTKLLFTAGLIPARYVLLVGIGQKKKFSLDAVRQIGAAMVKAVNEVKAASLAIVFQKTPIGKFATDERMQALVEGIKLGTYTFDKYKKEEDRKKQTLTTVHFLAAGNQAALEKAIFTGSVIADAVNLARDLGNTPALDMTPQTMAGIARDISHKYKLTATIMGPKEIKKEKMDAFLSVSKGSKEPPTFIHLKYRPSKKTKVKVALVGKGVTFDSGGISIKPARGMEQMKDDMSGAAAVLGVMQAVGQMKPNVSIDAYMPACENMPGGHASRPGDVVRARNGKTIEIISTDAEGRMILADALSYAADAKPDYIIDLATLTGACVYAVGERYTAVLGNDQRLIDRLKKSADASGEALWQLPLEHEYKNGLTKGIADLKNIGSSKADTINGALFLEDFVGDAKWAHLDIAPASWADEETSYSPKGCTGAGVRLLINFLMGL